MNTRISKGQLLIAEPFLGDPNFERTVTLICEHSPQGTFGLTLNQPADLRLGDVFGEELYADLPLYIGGPVQPDTLHFIHRLGDQVEDTLEIGEGLYWSGDYEQVRTLLNLGKISERDIRFFVGYAGWSAGQLQAEMERDSWIVSQAEPEFLFTTPPEHFWREILKKMNGKYKSLAHYPTDPRLN
jgi:putative transcriptional regulator